MSINSYTSYHIHTEEELEKILPGFREFVENYEYISPEDDPQCEPLDSGCTGSVAGPNHPARLWHQNDRPDDWIEDIKKRVTKDWQGERGEARKKDFSNKMKETWEKNRELLVAHCRKVATKGGIANKEKCAKRLEYNGKTYIGWDELKKETGVSKHLYIKYYMNGINPEYRIGKNGPEAA
tara:strand:+ start:238 stop:780 length:543 start_codon:yes stop_codon:yes gene_type:complete